MERKSGFWLVVILQRMSLVSFIPALVGTIWPLNEVRFSRIESVPSHPKITDFCSRHTPLLFVTMFISIANLLGIIFLLFCSGATSQYILHNADSSILIGASDACLSAYNTAVTCTPTIGYLYANHFPDLSTDDLEGLCTSNCLSSLSTHRTSVASACGSVQYYDDADGSFWPSTYLSDVALHLYDLTCLKRTSVLRATRNVPLYLIPNC